MKVGIEGFVVGTEDVFVHAEGEGRWYKKVGVVQGEGKIIAHKKIK